MTGRSGNHKIVDRDRLKLALEKTLAVAKASGVAANSDYPKLVTAKARKLVLRVGGADLKSAAIGRCAGLCGKGGNGSVDPSKWCNEWWQKNVQREHKKLWDALCSVLKHNRSVQMGRKRRAVKRRAREIRKKTKGRHWFHSWDRPLLIGDASRASKRWEYLRTPAEETATVEGLFGLEPVPKETFQELCETFPGWKRRKPRKHNAVETLQLKTCLKDHGKCLVQLRHEVAGGMILS